jgi:hypothetical protein
MDKTISRLINIPVHEIRTIIKKYGGVVSRIQPRVEVKRKRFRFPSECTALRKNHKSYLLGRGFDPNVLESQWGLMGTGPISKIDGKDYKHRIIAPIMWNGEPVSFQGRSIKDIKVKYKACPADREEIPHQHILYGRQDAWTDFGICVEGITDVWRFGERSFATFGIEYTRQQVREIAKQFKFVAIVYDDDPQAVKKASGPRSDLISELEFRDVIAWRVPITGDPGGMNQDEADEFVHNILKR